MLAVATCGHCVFVELRMTGTPNRSWSCVKLLTSSDDLSRVSTALAESPRASSAWERDPRTQPLMSHARSLWFLVAEVERAGGFSYGSSYTASSSTQSPGVLRLGHQSFTRAGLGMTRSDGHAIRRSG